MFRPIAQRVAILPSQIEVGKPPFVDLKRTPHSKWTPYPEDPDEAIRSDYKPANPLRKITVFAKQTSAIWRGKESPWTSKFKKRFVVEQGPDCLGAGDWGEVRRVFDCMTGKILAMKFDLSESDSEEESPSSSEGGELRILDDEEALVYHFGGIPHAVTYYGTVAINKNLEGILMSLAPPSLSEQLAKTPIFPIKEIYSLALQLLRFHMNTAAKNLLHADLCPSNICWGDRLVVIDFAAGGPVEEFLDVTIQKMPYRAPEVMKRKPYTPATDLWSIGCILFRVLCREEFILNYDSEQNALTDIAERLGHRSPQNPNSLYRRTIKPFSSMIEQEFKRRALSQKEKELLSILLHGILRYSERIHPEDAFKIAQQLFGMVCPSENENPAHWRACLNRLGKESGDKRSLEEGCAPDHKRQRTEPAPKNNS